MHAKSSDLIVCKFGGSSLADAKTFERVRNIVRADERRRTIVVSAPGKRFKGDEKVTDRLYALCRALKENRLPECGFDLAFGRFFCLKEKLGINFDLRKHLNIIKSRLSCGTDYVVSRGEYLCAVAMARYLGFEFVDAEDLFFFDENGVIDEKKTRAAIEKLPKDKGIVVPGFYGTGFDGGIKLFPRGGSDVSGAYLAAYSGATVYENWTDVSGVYERDPNVFIGQKPIERMTYERLKGVISAGACVIHEGAVPPLEKHGVTLKILNTFRPEDSGTTVE